VVLFLSRPFKRLMFFQSELHFHDSFLNTSTRCSVKCVREVELFCGLILIVIVSHVTLLASVAVFHCVSVVPNPVLRASSFLIAM
jgi:hypothetical protein